ncbi:hypothetical protein [Streptomyces sp. W1SF4]|uniref:DUF6895 family protein n=1 Tax=Streptomyces sp. W1SF4 TaxID=2305220 RepID=UPI000F718956|nr:hypothetical protein [Streptomyces sp. W1SF4]AZM87982.1 hypothetical protein D1J60_05390 [Streptomyces sp. W1SF4]
MASPLERLSSRALGWLAANLHHFDPFSAGARSAAPQGRAKAALELALLCHCAARLGRPVDGLDAATALVRRLWQDPALPPLFAAVPGYASAYGLACAALAPDGIDGTQVREALAGVGPGFLSPRGRTPYQRIEVRHYADKAGVPHTVEPYAELLPHSPLLALRPVGDGDAPGRDGGGGGAPLTVPQAYAVTHTAFYVGDFGRTSPGLTGDAPAHALDLVDRLLLHCVGHDLWDLAAELVLTRFILGTDPLDSPSGAAAVARLVRAQRPDGALPGRSAELAARPAAPGRAFFRKAYHTTLVTALMALVVSSPRPS